MVETVVSQEGREKKSILFNNKLIILIYWVGSGDGNKYSTPYL